MGRVGAVLKRAGWLRAIYRSLGRLYNSGISCASPFLARVPAGHFYSPLPDAKWVRAHQDSLFRADVTGCPGLDLREERQLAVLGELAGYYADLRFPASPSNAFRYHYENDYFSYGDAIVLYGMLRRLRPGRVIEVGSGFSSAVMLDTDDDCLDRRTRFTFIDPYPQRLLGLLGKEDQGRCEVVRQPVQEVDPGRFEALEEGDVLFIDSSHVVKIGSDVNHLLTRVLPSLRPGVLVHFHDVFWPFEYPKDWVLDGRAWNEAYFLRAFLQYNPVFQIEYFNSFMAVRHAAVLREKMPLCTRNPGGSLWIRRTA
jgi:predicted O-methyltransferase YrrM